MHVLRLDPDLSNERITSDTRKSWLHHFFFDGVDAILTLVTLADTREIGKELSVRRIRVERDCCKSITDIRFSNLSSRQVLCGCPLGKFF